MCLFFVWCFDVKYVWFTLCLILCNYCDVICKKLCDFYVCHSKSMFHPFEYLKYWICTYIIHIIYNMEFKQFLYKPTKIEFCIEYVWNYKA